MPAFGAPRPRKLGSKAFIGDYSPVPYVVNNDGTATTQPVTVERTLDSLTVLAGVPAGALVVTDGQLRLTPNAKVDIRAGPTTESAGGGGAEGVR